MKKIAWINLMAGLWLIVASFTIAAAAPTTAPAVNDIIIGLLLIGSSWWILGDPEPTSGTAWLQTFCGIWLIVSPFLLPYRTAATVSASALATAPSMMNALITGIVVVIVGLFESASAVRHYPA